MEEIWKDIPNYKGYQASNLGHIKSIKRIIIRADGKPYTQKSQILKPSKNKKGYLQVGLTKNFSHKTIFVHRLIAITFIQNPHNMPQVNHIDGNKENNNVNNLEWCDNLYNMRHSIKLGLRDNARKALKKCNFMAIKQYDLQGNFIKNWNSMKDVEKKLNIPNQNISKVCQGKRKSAGGYVWKYENISKLKKCKYRTQLYKV